MSVAAVEAQERIFRLFPNQQPQYERINGQDYDAKAMSMARAALRDNGNKPVIARDESELLCKALFDGNPRKLTDPERRAARKIAFEFPFSTEQVRRDFIKSLRRKDPDALTAPQQANIWSLNLLALLAAEEAVHNNKGDKAITREESEQIARLLKQNGISGADRETAKFIANNYKFSAASVKRDFKESMQIAFSH